MTDSTLAVMIAAIIKFIGTTLPAAIGSFVSLRFIPITLTKKERFFSLLSGYFLGSYFGRGLVEYLSIKTDHIADAVIFGVALFGLSVVGNAMVEVQPLVQALRQRCISIINKEK